MHVHTHEGGGLQQATSQETASSPTTPLPVISRACHPACHLPASHQHHLSPTQLVTHPAHHLHHLSPTQPVTRAVPDRHLGGGQEMGRRRPQGCGAGGPRDPVGPPLQLGILQHRHGNLSAATTFPNISRTPPQALLLAKLKLRRA